MKFIIIILDGLSDVKYKEIENKTPVEYAKTPFLDILTSKSIIGKVKTVPDELAPGSDVAIMSILGYNPLTDYMARGPLEAISLDLPIKENEIVFRCNTVTIENEIMISSNSNHISSKQSKDVISFFNKKNKFKGIKLYPGVGYRHILVIDQNEYPNIDFENTICTPPHDIVNQNISNYMPNGSGQDLLIEFDNYSKQILSEYNETTNNKVTNFWLWGQSKTKPLPNFSDKLNIKGAVISAVDLIKGFGKYINLQLINVPDVTAYYDTNFSGKAEYAINELENNDLVIVHIEATDEAGHDGDLKKKIEMVEIIDKKVISYISNKINKFDNYRILILPDHPTPVYLRTHINEPVPYIIFDNKLNVNNNQIFSENFEFPKKNYINPGYNLIKYFIEKELNKNFDF